MTARLRLPRQWRQRHWQWRIDTATVAATAMVWATDNNELKAAAKETAAAAAAAG